MKHTPATQRPRTTPSSWRRLFTVLPGLGATLLPVGACPACWSAYAGFLSTAGLGFLFDSTYLLPIAALLLTFALVSLAYRASGRRGYAPFALGTFGATLALWGKFALTSDTLLYVGLAGLTIAALWNAWPRRAAPAPSCPNCTPREESMRNEARPKGGSVMSTKHKVEVFSAGCPTCEETIAMVRQIACPSCDVSVLDMQDTAVATRAKALGIRSVPAVVIDGELTACCADRGPGEAALRAAGLGQALP